MSGTVACHTLYGDTRQVPVERLHLRASVYGFIVWEGKLLLLTGRFTNKYALPGGGIDVGERIEAALKREIREETGLEVAVHAFLHFKEDFFYYDPADAAFHGLLFFYRCTPLSFDLLADEDVDDGDVSCPRWIALDSLTESAFQTQGAITMQLVRAHFLG